MQDNLTIRYASLSDINTIRELALQIWPATYGHLMSAEKLEYMLQMIYSQEALQQQMQLDHTFLLAAIDNKAVGFASFSKIAEPGIYKLHKIYVNTNIQGKGLGKSLINAVIEAIQSSQATALHLNVKRDNTAIAFYEKMGFSIIREEDIDIGNGYFMNDYVMEKVLDY